MRGAPAAWTLLRLVFEKLDVKLEQGIPGFVVGIGGRIRTVESRKEVEGQGMGCHVRVKNMRNVDSRGLMWMDSCCIFSDDMDKLTWMVNDLIEELMDLDMEPKPEWLWWTSTDTAEDGVLLKVGSRGQIGT